MQTAPPVNGPSRLLLVDDEPFILRSYARLLSGPDRAIETAPDGASAIAMLRRGSPPFDVIISDIAMPSMSGVEFLRAVREHDLDIPVVLMTADPTVETAMRAVEYGAFRYLAKPVEPEALEETVQQALRMHRYARVRREAAVVAGGADARPADRAGLEAQFERALAAMWIAFQPIVSWLDRRVFGWEALLRTDEAALARPPDFLAAAEQLGRLNELGRAVRARVAEAARGIAPDELVFVNVHPRDLGDDELLSPDSPLSAIAPRVVLEITERSTLDDIADLRTRASALRRLGFRLAVDDLGAGYAGLTSLTRLSPDVVKIDMSLARDVSGDPTKQRVIRSLTSMCADLGMRVITEGVETAAERDTLAELGCDLLQGYFFAKPGRGLPSPRWAA